MPPRRKAPNRTATPGKAARAKGGKFELLLEKWFWLNGHDPRWVHRYRAAGAGKGFSIAHDLYGVGDVQAIVRSDDRFSPWHEDDGPNAAFWVIQATDTASTSTWSAKRRKLEKIPWPPNTRASLVVHTTTEDPTRRGRSVHWLRIEDFDYGDGERRGPSQRTWRPPFVLQFDPKACEAFARELKAQQRSERVT